MDWAGLERGSLDGVNLKIFGHRAAYYITNADFALSNFIGYRLEFVRLLPTTLDFGEL